MKKDKIRKFQKSKLKRKLERPTSVERKIETIAYGQEYYENVIENQKKD